MKPKRCRACKNLFIPSKPLQVACGYECALLIAKNKRVSDGKTALQHQKRELKAAKLAIKSRSDWVKEAQQAFNAWRRTEDGINREGECISCGTIKGKQNAGHYRSVGSAPELRFEPLNIWLQCEKCNTHLHSNAIQFRISLLNIIGKEKLDWLEGKHEPKHYTIEDLKKIKALYKTKVIQLLKEKS